MYPHRLIRSRWLLVGIACSSTFAAAQGKGVLGQDNPDFARKLFEEGYADLSGSLCRTIEANAPSALDQLAVTTLGFDLRFAEAKRENDVQKRAQVLRQTIQDENAFLKDNSRTRAAEDVRANLPNVYIDLAAALDGAFKLEKDPAKGAAIQQEARQILEEAKDTLKKRRDDFAQRIADKSGNAEYNQRQHEFASYNLAKMNFHHSQLFPKGSPERKALLTESLKGFKDFGFEYPDSRLNYLGVIYQGKCDEELGDLEDALQAYQDVIALRELFEPDATGVFQMGAENAGVVSGATLQLVKLLTQMKREREAIVVAVDFLKRTPDPLLTNSGPEILAAKAEAEIRAGDVPGASSTAQMLVDLDPQGWAGRTGREILGRLPIFGLSPDKILKIAETAAGRGDFSRALDLSRQAREMVRGARDEQDVGSAALLLCGFIYRTQGRPYEASAAYDLAAELYPKGKSTPEALYSAVFIYRQFATKERSSRFYSGRADQRMNTLATKYPDSPRAASAGIYQGQRREDDKDFVGARDFYSKISKDSPSYFEAQFRLANATNQQGRDLLKEKPEDAKPLLATAEGQYQNAMSVIQAAQQETLDPAVQARLAGLLINCRLGLASVYLDTNKPEKVSELLAGLEQKVTDADIVADIWSKRITALQALGRVDDAVKLFESLLQSSASSPAIGGAAGILARALDGAAQDLFTKDPTAKRAGELWRKAAYYYSLSVKGALEGTAPLRSDDVKQVAQRLYVIGLFFNAVPEGQFTFVDWQGTVAEPDLWEEAARIYEKLDAQAPSTQVSIDRARTLAILGHVAEAEAIYARLFDQVSLFATGDKSDKFDSSVIQARPELITAYLEWGVASHVVGLATQQEALLSRAESIYKRMIANCTDSSRLWWQTRFSQIRLLSDRGKYELAKDAIQNVKRNTDPQYDKGQFGFKDKFISLEAELSKKVFK